MKGTRAASRTSRTGFETDAKRLLADSARAMARLPGSAARPLAEAAASMVACLQSGGTVYFAGNGGSAADAQHLAAELAGRYFVDRPALAAVALTTNTSSLTAIGNDFGFDVVFSRQLEGVGSPGDVLVALSTSGGSRNVLRAVEAAHELGMIVIGMTGSKGGAFAKRCDVALVTPSDSTPRIQEGHIVMGHAMCELVEHAMFPGPARKPAAARARRPGGRAAGGARARRPRA